MPDAVNALGFAQSLVNALPKDWDGGVPEEGTKNWSQFMAARLVEAARELKLGVCATGSGAPSEWSKTTLHSGYAREFLFDYTMFRDWDSYTQPEVILEHENAWSVDAFMEDFWKLMVGYAPLRVMIGYCQNLERTAEYVTAIRKSASEGNWRYPPGVEDLVLIGHGRMTPRGFKVVNRRAESQEWVEWPDLESYLRQEAEA
ncbi:hypothetical protein OWM54_19370 [Myxococcus sp. MISCRS1]|uniref:hypothetical protein n=1 Tax=unclassified Myxococcus TaxID=2648731 RepID=UPI001CC0AED2|nr:MULTISPECIES: hypothetical protein [unclassified Myxococcus]MBZ4395346.1 hypothetical protein [Myxococcus sp. AS-1-15]MCY0999300.1 hypothetical protein [Myxococcus sp. MISCRS1]